MLAEELEGALCDEQNVCNEELVFQEVIRQTEADLQAWKKYLESLICSVWYGLMSFKFFIDGVMNNTHSC